MINTVGYSPHKKTKTARKDSADIDKEVRNGKET
ncbi:hypothetical protein EDF76_0666 [Raoultella terrigena]|nr:hypothetical protein EDF76_0666 [Raoultella terrigena]